MKVAGIIVVLIGIALTIFTSVKFFTKEKVVDLGKLEVTADKPHKLDWSPLVGVAVIAVGGILLWQGSKK